MRKPSFLAVFFLLLGVAFAAAVWLRLRSFDADRAVAVQQTASAANDVMQEGRTAVRSDGSVQVPAADGTVVDVATPTAASSGVSAREQRYNELLRSAPPPAPAPPKAPADDRSLLQKMVSPIANALGFGKPGEKQPPVAPSAQQQRMQQQRAQQQAQQQAEQAQQQPGTSTDPQQETDEDTDVEPPTLVAVQFTPPQIQDGEETIFAAIVNDNLSGVRSVSGVIASPSGALQGFACQREGDSNRYVAKITIPRDAAEGVWMIKYLTLTDNASNSINLNAGQGRLPATATFKVQSRQSDSTGPVLKAAWVEKQMMQAGDRNTVFVQADDDKSGVALVSGVFVSPAKQARIGFGCRLGSTGAWECPLTPPACGDCGTWTLEQIQLQDKANNMVTFRGDNPVVKAVAVDITGEHCDSTPPVLTSLTLDPLVVSNMEGGAVRATAVIADEGCGVASLSGQAVPPGNVGGQRLYFSLSPQPDGKTFAGTIAVPQHAAKGTWTIAWLQALDKGHNLKAYSANDPVVSRATFRVE